MEPAAWFDSSSLRWFGASRPALDPAVSASFSLSTALMFSSRAFPTTQMHGRLPDRRERCRSGVTRNGCGLSARTGSLRLQGLHSCCHDDSAEVTGQLVATSVVEADAEDAVEFPDVRREPRSEANVSLRPHVAHRERSDRADLRGFVRPYIPFLSGDTGADIEASLGAGSSSSSRSAGQGSWSTFRNAPAALMVTIHGPTCS